MNNRTALLIDGTALYLASRHKHEEGKLDYLALHNELLDRANVERFEPAISFSTFESWNEGQRRFHEFVQRELKWNLDVRTVGEAWPLSRALALPEHIKRNELIRFDAAIAFSCGKLLNTDCKQIVVVTDSFGVEQFLQAVAQSETTRVALSFFRSHLDERWPLAFSKKENRIEFWDLDEPDQTIFGTWNSPKSPLSRL